MKLPAASTWGKAACFVAYTAFNHPKNSGAKHPLSAMAAQASRAYSNDITAKRIARGVYTPCIERATLARRDPCLLQKANEASLLRLRLKARMKDSRNKMQRDQAVMHAVSTLLPPPGTGRSMDTQTALLRMEAIRAAQQQHRRP